MTERTVAIGSLPAVNRLLIGLWQLSSPAWGSASKNDIISSMKKHYDAGMRTFDMADHYGDAELLYADFRRSLHDPKPLLGFTKWCPQPGPMTRSIVETAMRDRLRRMNTTTIDCLQFHWWDYSDKRYLDALLVMKQLKDEGLISNIALTNFDTERLEEMVNLGIPIASNQVQYSLVDLRPDVRMGPFCEKHGIKLLTYGTFCGGWLSDKYLNAPPPKTGATPSQRKYLQMINVFGGWNLFQDLLKTLKVVGDRHNVSIANVATRFILERPAVGGVIVGSRLGQSDHIEDNEKVFSFKLSQQDYEEINKVLAKSNSAKMFEIVGDCGDEYRR